MGETNNKRKEGKKIREGFEGWLKMDKREKMAARGEDPEDISFDDIPNDDNGVNTRTGFP